MLPLFYNCIFTQCPKSCSNHQRPASSQMPARIELLIYITRVDCNSILGRQGKSRESLRGVSNQLCCAWSLQLRQIICFTTRTSMLYLICDTSSYSCYQAAQAAQASGCLCRVNQHRIPLVYLCPGLSTEAAPCELLPEPIKQKC